MNQITPDGKFVVENYNWEKSFANFFPGIAGRYGIPVWTYYVSRNQGVCSMGVRDKNNQIMEFLPFNKALEYTGLQGFRTFIKSDGEVYEPFLKTDDPEIRQRMIVSAAELELQEENPRNGLETEVLYFQLPDCSFPGLVRRLTVTNRSGKTKKLEVIDGLPRILARGMDLHCVTTIARHVEGMIEVNNSLGIPLYRLKQSPADTEKVDRIEGGNFYVSFIGQDDNLRHGSYFYDPVAVFEDAEIYTVPWRFKQRPLEEMFEGQIGQNRTPCAMTGTAKELKEGEQLVIYSMTGSADTDAMVELICSGLSPAFMQQKQRENRELMESIMNRCLTVSSNSAFDRYCGQTFLDNVVRGGMPLVFDTAEGKSAFYTYSRQNGDLERDYHFFIVEPTYLSQGTGHYRSVNQNRRADTWFFPEIGDRNLVTFMNLIQFDGYNPLELTQMTYAVKEQAGAAAWLDSFKFSSEERAGLERLIAGSFAPGEVLMALEAAGIKEKDKFHAHLQGLLRFCTENECGGIHEGFWADHWLYNFDLIENYLMIYPEKAKALLLDNNGYYFYDDPDLVMPRDKKYLLIDGTVYQYNAVQRSREKEALLASRKKHPMMARTRNGKGEVYRTNLLVKLLCQIANRIACIDPAGVGVEMEADKPGWNDSMNGLPGIIGSSLCQTVELENILNILDSNLRALAEQHGDLPVNLYSELDIFLSGLKKLLDEYNRSSSPDRDFVYWNESNRLKEAYREATNFGIDGKERETGVQEILEFIAAARNRIAVIYTEKRDAVFNPQGVPYTYYRNVVTEYEIIKDEQGNPQCNRDGHPFVRALKFTHEKLPLFLEGAVHMMKVHPELAPQIYRAVKESNIYDRKLKMYKVCESLEDAPFEIGRVKAWGPGWIENESVYTHMLYKYLLEILKSGLYQEYFEDIKTMMMCFLDPKVYGRSTLENVSFIVSSAFPDSSQHGRGLQARLSGVTGEMVNQWILMAAGKEPFSLDETGALQFKLEPVLPAELFTQSETKHRFINEARQEETVEVPADSVVVRLFSRVTVIYNNPLRRDTFGSDGVMPVAYRLTYRDGSSAVVQGSVLGSQPAGDIRAGAVQEIFVTLG